MSAPGTALVDQRRDAAAYAEAQRQLLPPGKAWEATPGGPFAGLLRALGEEMARLDARGLAVVDEADPRAALELLPDWERVAALPDTCTGVPDTASERQAALHQKLTRPGAQNAAAYIELAARAGYAIEIVEHLPLRTGFRAGMRCNGQDWAFTWTAKVKPFEGYIAEDSFLAVFRVGSRAGELLRGWGALNVECLIRRAAPAHTIVLFAYDVEYDPAFWIDFTE